MSAPPELPHSADVRTEYAVIVDRRSQGLGYYLAHIRYTQEAAELAASEIADYPTEIHVRQVYKTAWQPIGPRS